jgi:hypothetical protein
MMDARVKPAHDEVKDCFVASAVARMSEAISGVYARSFPDVASLIRATISAT